MRREIHPIESEKQAEETREREREKRWVEGTGARGTAGGWRGCAGVIERDKTLCCTRDRWSKGGDWWL